MAKGVYKTPLSFVSAYSRNEFEELASVPQRRRPVRTFLRLVSITRALAPTNRFPDLQVRVASGNKALRGAKARVSSAGNQRASL